MWVYLCGGPLLGFRRDGIWILATSLVSPQKAPLAKTDSDNRSRFVPTIAIGKEIPSHSAPALLIGYRYNDAGTVTI